MLLQVEQQIRSAVLIQRAIRAFIKFKKDMKLSKENHAARSIQVTESARACSYYSSK